MTPITIAEICESLGHLPGAPICETIVDYLAKYDPSELCLETSVFTRLIRELSELNTIGVLHVPMDGGGIVFAGPFRRIPITFEYVK